MGALKAFLLRVSPGARVRLALAGLVLLGAALRIYACLTDGPLHPDEYFQYLEPAYWHLTGAGIEAWEFQRGLRSWVLPFYNGAWMALLMQLGVQRGATLGMFVKLTWALVNTSLVGVAFRGGSVIARRVGASGAPGAPSVAGVEGAPAGFEGGLLAALLCAGFWPLVLYAGHTLSEMPSMLCMVSGLVLTAELTEKTPGAAAPADPKKAALVGVLLSLGACLRIANGPLALVPVGWLLLARRRRDLGALAFAALVPALVFGLVDLATWGTFGSSFIAYLKFNVVEGKAVRFGREPLPFYVTRLWAIAPIAFALLLAASLAGLPGTLPYVISALGLLGYLSTQEHKEGRFVIGFWPLVLIAAGGTLGAWLQRARGGGRRERIKRLALPLVLAFTAAVLVDGQRNPYKDYWLTQDRVTGLTWAGAQPDLTGLLVDESTFAAGALWFGNRAPQLTYRKELLANPLITHVLLPLDSEERDEAEAAGFRRVFKAGHGYVVLRRGASR